MPPIGRRAYLKHAGVAAAFPLGSRSGRGETVRTTARSQTDSSPASSPPAPTRLRAEYRASPDNLPPLTDPVTGSGDGSTESDAREPFVPRFSWQVPATDRGAGQRAYRLLVASRDDLLDVDVADVYDSGRVDSDRSTVVSFDLDGMLEPDGTYYWKVRVWNEDDEASPWSEPASFTMAIPDTEGQWDGTWIGGKPPEPVHEPQAAGPVKNHDSPLLRKELTLEKPVAEARAHVVTLGYGEVYVNGERIGDERLNPGLTEYQQRVLYTTYDVTDELSAGVNALGLWLGRGWFSKTGFVPLEGHEGLSVNAPRYPTGPLSTWESHGQPRALVQLTVEYDDGTIDTIGSDASWSTAPSPITENDVWDGERYDAVLEQPGWAEPGFDETGWPPAAELGPPDTWDDVGPTDPALRPQRTQPIEVVDTLEPASIRTFEGDHIVDFGQNFAGWVELTIRNSVPGTEVTLKHAEILRENGDIDRRNLRTADATDTYVTKGEDGETYEPRFTYHGFRYAKIEGYPGELSPEDVSGKVVTTAFERTGSFACSNDDLNRVQHNTVWSLQTNAHSVPTDCPQRDERNGWTEIWRGAPADLFNFDAVRFYEKWLRDHAVNQGDDGSQTHTVPDQYGGHPTDPNWGKSQVMTPWTLFRHTGDERVLEDHYLQMRAYVDFWRERARDGERDHVVPAQYNVFGEWLAPGEETDPALLNTFAYYQTTDVVAETAALLGRDEDAQTYRERADAIAAAFNDAFFDPDANTYANGTQGAAAVPLFLGIVPDEHEPAVADRLATRIRDRDDGKLQTGSPTTRALLYALVEYGHEELAYNVVSQPEYPGWVHMVRNGATTLWERWDALDADPGMNSYNHRLWMEVSAWFYRTLAGIDAAEPGFEHVEIAPAVVEDLDWAEGSTETVRGEVASAWERTGDGLRLDATIPWNTTGTIRIPDLDAEAVRLREGDRVVWHGRAGEGGTDQLPVGIESVTRTADTVIVEVGSGSYDFTLERLTDEDGSDEDESDEDNQDGEDETSEPTLPGADWTDYTFETTFHVEEHLAGVAFRVQNARNMYLWQVVPDEPPLDATGPHVLRALVVEDGAFETLATVPFVLPTLEDRYKLRIELRGDTIETFVNSQHVVTTTDDTHASGTIGFRQHPGTPNEHAMYDAVSVTDPAGTVLFEDAFSHDCVKHFSGGRITDGTLDLDGTGVVTRRNRDC